MRLLLIASATRVLGTCGVARHQVPNAPLPDRVWAAALEVLAMPRPEPPTSLTVTTDSDDIVLLDVETLGSPAPVLSREALRTLPDDAPHTWALVESGRYAVLGLDGYLAARLTRGVWLVGLDPVGRGAEVERVAPDTPIGSTDADCAGGWVLPLSLGNALDVGRGDEVAG